jgi:hypothetical protein
MGLSLGQGRGGETPTEGKGGSELPRRSTALQARLLRGEQFVVVTIVFGGGQVYGMGRAAGRGGKCRQSEADAFDLARGLRAGDQGRRT